jgi:hypothetical protein
MPFYYGVSGVLVDMGSGLPPAPPAPVGNTGIATAQFTAFPAGSRDSLVPGAYRPSASTTGVLPGSTFVITSTHTPVSNTTYTNLDVRNNVLPGATVGNVTYKNCIFRGPNTPPASASSLYTMFRPHLRSFVFEDCTFLPQLPDYRWNGLQGYGFTLRRCDISNLVDCVEVFNSNPGLWTDGVTLLTDAPSDVIVEQCYFHDQAFFLYGTGGNGSGGETTSNGSHSDGIQWEGTTGLTVRYNYFTGQLAPAYQPNYYGATNTNSAMMIKPDAGAISGADIHDNWFSGGAVTINIADAPTHNRYIANLGSLVNNRFGRDNQYYPTMIELTIATAGHTDIGGTFTGNVFDDNSAATTPYRNYV